MSFSAVILAGGKSSRMGRDKALLELDGKALLARQIQLARNIGAAEVFISARVDADYSSFGYPLLCDRFINAGPLAGIESALRASKNPMVLVLAVDMPAISVEFLHRLLRQCGTGLGVIPRFSDHTEPLLACYPKSAHPIALNLLENNSRGVKQFAEASVAAGLAKFLDLPNSDALYFINWNSPADLPCLK